MALAKALSIYVNGVDLALNAFKSASFGSEIEELDTTTLGTSGLSRTYTGGFEAATATAEGVWQYDQTNADEIHNILSSAMTNRTQNVITGSYAAIAVNGVAWLMDAVETSYSIDSPLGQLIMASGEFRGTSGVGFGRWLFNAEVDTTTTNGTSVDNSASTANGGLFHVHYQNGAGTEDLTAKIQHSANNSTWADLGTITLSNLTGFGASSLDIAAGTTVNRYIRAQIAVAQGALNVQAAFARR